ncbi:hypothetical protein CMU49_02430 [Elizabethkingia anophelis]|nr:hypothetical protein [Elizabethkingia anophelis]MDV3692368.1 hypothetical protein [Elizabethkingia anophelis]
MNSKELRIGNIVNRLGEPHFITAIHSDGNVGIDTRKHVFIYEVEPIQLTEEWLLKFGFILKSDINGEYYEKNGVKVLILRSETNHFFFGNPNTKEKFVHELQNYYYGLTGEDI